MKNKSVHSCRFVHHAKFHCFMTTLNKFFKIKFERGGLEKSQKIIKMVSLHVTDPFDFSETQVAKFYLK